MDFNDLMDASDAIDAASSTHHAATSVR
jgi:hypothetical protein